MPISRRRPGVYSRSTPALRLVRELVTRPGSAELIVLAAYRDADLDSPLSPSQPLARLVADLRREGRVTRMRLGGLGETEIAELAVYLASDASAFTTGQIHVIDGGWTM